MLLFSDYCLSCLETTTARQGKKVWILNGMKNLTAALLPASTVRQFLQRQGWMHGSMLNCVGKAQPSYMQYCPCGAGPVHWCGRPLPRQSTAIPLGRGALSWLHPILRCWWVGKESGTVGLPHCFISQVCSSWPRSSPFWIFSFAVICLCIYTLLSPILSNCFTVQESPFRDKICQQWKMPLLQEYTLLPCT